jgi:DNA helicase-2/ATP-dependent DNA helicase PcrA
MDEERRKAEELQRAVVDYPDACYVQACPGAGKTQTLVRRVMRQLPALPLRQGIAVLSFTNSAIDEFRDRYVAEGNSWPLSFPHFVGTFDRFLNHFFLLPGGIAGVGVRPIVVDAWNTIMVGHGVQNVRAAPLPLKRFNVDGRLDGRTIRRLSPAQVALQEQYEANAKWRLDQLRRKGKLDTVSARRIAISRLEDQERADALGAAIAARFTEIVVDEAQDCNDDDVAILKWLQSHGVRLVLVCDPDQAIYGFRKGEATAFNAFAATFHRLELIGNFRGSRIICAAAATMRERAPADLAVGNDFGAGHPVHLIPYKSSIASKASVAEAFYELTGNAGLDPEKCIVLAHKRVLAERISANRPQSIGGEGMLKWLADSVVGYHAESATATQRVRSVQSMVSLIMKIEGAGEDDRASMRSLIEDPALNREYHRKAIEILEQLPHACADDSEAQAWIPAANDVVSRALGVPKRFKLCGNWSDELRRAPGGGIPHATIHEAKGKAFDAVCLVIDIGKENSDILDEWEGRKSSEALRVLYVGLTRARKLAAIAVPTNHMARVRQILLSGDVPVSTKELI